MAAPKTDHATATAKIALATAKAASVAAAAAATAATAQLVAIARLEERQKAGDAKFDTFYIAWDKNATEVKEAIKSLATRIESHDHGDLRTCGEEQGKAIDHLNLRDRWGTIVTSVLAAGAAAVALIRK